jgi:hypothetical protein
VNWRLYVGDLWYETPVRIKHSKETSGDINEGKLFETVYRRIFLLQGRVPSAEIVYLRKITSIVQKTYLSGFSKTPYSPKR